MKKIPSLLSTVFLLVTFSTGYCTTSLDDATLARQCFLTSNRLFKLSRLQIDSACEIMLRISSKDTEIAGKEIINQQYDEAKLSIKNALLAVKYTELHDCKYKSEITVLINDVIEINGHLDE